MGSTYLGRVADLRGITELLYEHTWGLFDADNNEYSEYLDDVDAHYRCECGWEQVDETGHVTDHSEHVASVLKENYDIKPREFSD